MRQGGQRCVRPAVHPEGGFTMVAATAPGTAVGGGLDSGDFFSSKESEERTVVTLRRNREDPLDHRQVRGVATCGVVEERSQSSEPSIPASNCIVPLPLEMIEE